MAEHGPPPDEPAPATDPDEPGPRIRSAAYALLAGLVDRGPQPAWEDAVVQSPTLAEALGGRERDAVLADHHHAFDYHAPPLAGLFMDPEAAASGAAGDAIRTQLVELEVAPPPDAHPPEHLCSLLASLAALSGFEADCAASAEDPAATRRVRQAQAQLIDACLLPWLPLWAGAVRRTRLAWPSALATQVEDLVLLHRGTLGGVFEAAWVPPVQADILDDPDTGFREIAALLVTPARIGLLIGHDDLIRIGRLVDVPRGFGDRRTRMHNLLTAAVRFEALDRVVGAFRDMVDETADALRGERYAQVAIALTPWLGRLDQTRTLLTRLGDAVRSLDDEDAGSVTPGDEPAR